jgi:hypothetical protein
MVWLELSAIQKHIYRQFLDSDRVKDALASSRSPLVALTVLKKVCDSPLLLAKAQQQTSAGNVPPEAEEAGEEVMQEEEEEGEGETVQRLLDTWLRQSIAQEAAGVSQGLGARPLRVVPGEAGVFERERERERINIFIYVFVCVCVCVCVCV